MGNISHESRVHESVDDKSCLGIYLKNRRKTEFTQQMVKLSWYPPHTLSNQTHAHTHAGVASFL